ncbi:hypothetical protein F5Y14DRAFT_460627 [Nemania sp. NC0429]|nr:hypothetical protein F5Y14DRAFT_460627 [Nemania sp. NC0429]
MADDDSLLFCAIYMMNYSPCAAQNPPITRSQRPPTARTQTWGYSGQQPVGKENDLKLTRLRRAIRRCTRPFLLAAQEFKAYRKRWSKSRNKEKKAVADNGGHGREGSEPQGQTEMTLTFSA